MDGFELQRAGGGADGYLCTRYRYYSCRATASPESQQRITRRWVDAVWQSVRDGMRERKDIHYIDIL